MAGCCCCGLRGAPGAFLAPQPRRGRPHSSRARLPLRKTPQNGGARGRSHGRRSRGAGFSSPQGRARPSTGGAWQTHPGGARSHPSPPTPQCSAKVLSFARRVLSTWLVPAEEGRRLGYFLAECRTFDVPWGCDRLVAVFQALPYGGLEMLGTEEGTCLFLTWAVGPAAGGPFSAALLFVPRINFLGRLCSVLGDAFAHREHLGYARWWGLARRRSRVLGWLNRTRRSFLQPNWVSSFFASLLTRFFQPVIQPHTRPELGKGSPHPDFLLAKIMFPRRVMS